MSSHLLDGDYDPVTWNIGFMKAASRDVLQASLSRQNYILEENGLPENEVRPTSGSLRSSLEALLPLCSYPVNWLLVDCLGENGMAWTTYFDNSQVGSDCAAFILSVSRDMGVSAVSFSMAANGPCRGYGFSFWHPGDFMPSRSVSLITDHGIWHYEEHGDPLAVECGAFARKRRARDSFGSEEVLALAGRLGLRPSDPRFFEGVTGAVQGYIVRRPVHGSSIRCRSLSDVRRSLGTQ